MNEQNRLRDRRRGGLIGLAAGEWTDDTSLALALAESIAACGWDLHDQADRYVDWWQRGAWRPRCGPSTRRATSKRRS